MKKRSLKVHNRKKNIKETILIFVGILIILFLVFSLTRAIVQRGIKKLTGDTETEIKLIVKTPEGSIATPNTLTPIPLKVVKKSVKKKITPSPKPTPTKKVVSTKKTPKAPEVKTSGKGRYYVQLGAFRSKENANKLMKTVKNMGYPVIVVKSGDLYKVRITGFSTRNSALSELKKLKKKGFEGFIGKK